MSDSLHKVNTDWRSSAAITYEMKALAVNEWLDHTEDLVKMFTEDAPVASTLRSAAGTLRAKRDDFSTQAEKLRAESSDQNGKKKWQ